MDLGGVARARVQLQVVVERGGRELPIQADVAGMHLDLMPNQQVKLQGPRPLHLAVTDVPPPAP